MNTRKELRFGVIGAGGRGDVADHVHKPEQGTRIVAGADIKEAALAKFKEQYGPDVFITTDYRRLLDRPDVDAVFVTTPDFLHEEHAIAALAAGKDVYLEKPMAITIEGCDRILETAVRHRRKLYLGHNMRHFPTMLKMKELIDAGAIGEVKTAWCRHFVCYGGDAYFKDWHSERDKSAGLLLQKGAHDIDILHWLCRGYTRRTTAMGALMVYGRVTSRRDASEPILGKGWSDENWPPLAQKGLNRILEVEDVSMMLMELDNGVLASYQQCHFTPDACRNYTFIGTEGRIENIGDTAGMATVYLWNRRKEYKPQGDVQFPIPPKEGPHGGGDPAIVAEFIRTLRDEAKATTSPIAGRYAVAAGCMATASLRNGSRPMDVPPVAKSVVEYFDGHTM